MGKLNRWRGGLKEGNRREKDMTSGTFNEGYLVRDMDPIGNTIDWKVAVNTTQHTLDTDRMEGSGYNNKTFLEDDVHSNNFVTNTLGTGLSYTDGESRSGLIRRGVLAEPTTLLSNVESGLDILSTDELPIRFITPTGPVKLDTEASVPVIPGEVYFADLWEFPAFPALISSIYLGIQLAFSEAGVPYRYSVYGGPSGEALLHQNTTDYEWELIKENYNMIMTQQVYPSTGIDLTEAWPIPTQLIYEDSYFIDKDTPLYVRIETATPMELLGSWARDEFGNKIPGPHDGFLFLVGATAIVRNVDIHSVYPVDLITRQDQACYEYAAREDATPHSIHSEDGNIILTEDCDYIEWFNPLGTLSTEDRLCNYEWSVREQASPGSIHSEDYCIILNNDNEYIEWLP